MFLADSSNNNNNNGKRKNEERVGVGEVPTTTLTCPVSVLVEVVNHDEPSVCSNISNGGLTMVTTWDGFDFEMFEKDGESEAEESQGEHQCVQLQPR